MALLLENKLLQAAEQKVESQLTPQNRDDYLRIVTSGMRSATMGGPNSMMAGLRNSKSPIGDVVAGAINLCLLMRVHSRGTMPPQAMVPAALTLMLKGLDFAQQMGIVRIGNAELVQATHLFTNTVFHKFGMTPQMIHTAAAKIHAITQNPQAMQKINLRAGLAKAPDAGDTDESTTRVPP